MAYDVTSNNLKRPLETAFSRSCTAKYQQIIVLYHYIMQYIAVFPGLFFIIKFLVISWRVNEGVWESVMTMHHPRYNPFLFFRETRKPNLQSFDLKYHSFGLVLLDPCLCPGGSHLSFLL